MEKTGIKATYSEDISMGTDTYYGKVQGQLANGQGMARTFSP